MTEREYRELQVDSYSTLKDFESDRKKYYKKYILKERILDEDEQESRASLIGSLTDCLLFTPDEFDRKFHISGCTNIPTGLMLKFVESLYKKTVVSLNENGELTRPFANVLKDAYDDVKYDSAGNVVAFKRDSFEKVIENFAGDAKAYYDEILAVRPTKKTVVNPEDINLAERLKLALKSNYVTSKVINLVSNDRFQVYHQLVITYKFEDVELKSMLDKVIIDHADKTINVYDLKVTWNVNNFLENYYLYRKSYLQGALYHIASAIYFKELIAKGYTLQPMIFIVADSLNYMNPLMYYMSKQDLQMGWEGFRVNGKEYRGLKPIINDLKWHKGTNIWNISKNDFDKKGEVPINIKYE